jgi:predicted ArsR family transcriptional regulator
MMSDPVKVDHESTRQLLIRLLREHGEMTARDLAKRIGVTPVAVRRHLAVLQSQGYVSLRAVRRKLGRPAMLYALTDQAQDLLPKNYHALANQLLDVLQSTQGPEAISNLFNGRLDQLYGQYAPRMSGKDLEGRIKELARIQDEAGYAATWEKTPDGYLLREQNCVILRVACRFQDACRFEIELFRRLLDADIERVEHQVQGQRCCTYRVHHRTDSHAL